jgi:hypothetical protein
MGTEKEQWGTTLCSTGEPPGGQPRGERGTASLEHVLKRVNFCYRYCRKSYIGHNHFEFKSTYG